MAKVIGVDPGSGCWNESGRATGGTGLVMVDGARLVHFETVVGDPSMYFAEMITAVSWRISELVEADRLEWNGVVEFPVNPVRRARSVCESAVIAGGIYTWMKSYLGEVWAVEAGRFPKVTPPPELVGRRFKGERRMNAPAPHLCATRDHEQDAYSLARFVQGQLVVVAA